MWTVRIPIQNPSKTSWPHRRNALGNAKKAHAHCQKTPWMSITKMYTLQRNLLLDQQLGTTYPNISKARHVIKTPMAIHLPKENNKPTTVPHLYNTTRNNVHPHQRTAQHYNRYPHIAQIHKTHIPHTLLQMQYMPPLFPQSARPLPSYQYHPPRNNKNHQHKPPTSSTNRTISMQHML